MSEEELDEVNYILAATNNVAASTIAPTTIHSTTDLDDDDRALSGITSTTASHFRPSSIATTATIVHIQGQQQQQQPPPVRSQVKKNHVIFYDSLAPSYHTVIKVITKQEKYEKEKELIKSFVHLISIFDSFSYFS